MATSLLKRRAGWLAIAALGFVPALSGCQRPAASAPTPLPPEVFYTTPTKESVTDYEEFPGRTEAFRSIEVRARVTGYLDKVLFVDGNEIEKDALLFEIDPRPYKAIADKAKSTLEQAEALQTRLEADYRRLSALYNRGTATREEFDRAAGDLAEARGSVGIAKAQVDSAQLDLDFTRVTAAIPGRISRRMVDPGNLVKADDTLLTTIVSLDPVYVYFDIDERTLLRIRRLIREGKMKSRSEADVPILAALADETEFHHKGTIDFSENRVDPSTGTLRIRGVIQNPLERPSSNSRVLSPGMFLRVRLPIGDAHPALLVPEQAVGTDQGRKFLYVINTTTDKEGKSASTVEYRSIEVGKLLGRGLRVVEKGLNPDDRVVIRGLQRIKQGARVTPVADPEFAPTGMSTDKTVPPTAEGKSSPAALNLPKVIAPAPAKTEAPADKTVRPTS